MATKLGDAYVTVQPDFSGFQEKVAAKLNESLGPAMDRAGRNASKRLSKSLGNDTSLRSSLQPLLKRFQKDGDNLGEELAARIGKGAKRAEGDMFGLSGAIKAMEKNSSSASSKAKIFANDTFGIAHAARDAGQGYKLLRNSTSGWAKDAKKADAVGTRLAKSMGSLFSDVRDVGRNLKAAAGGFGNFEGIMARANRGFQFFRNILGSLKFPAFVQGVALLAQGLSALAAGAVATASALAPLSGALIALPALALAGASAVGTLKLALSGIGDAVKAAVKVQVAGGEQATQTLNQQENAAEALADAHRTLKDSERAAEYATEDLTKARKDATAQLHELERASRESRLTEQEGTLALREARKELNKTLREPGSTGFDIRAAEQAVERAEFGLEATREEAKKARKDYADANKNGVEGMPEVVSAKRSLADADRSVKDAERGVAKAVRENTAALEQQGSAATALQQKMAELTPSGRKFAKFLISLKPRYDELRETASKGLFPGAESGIRDALKNAGVIKKIVGETSGALGGLAAKAGAKLGSEAWGRDLAKIGESDTRIIERLGQAGLNLGDAFRNVTVSAQPLLDWMSEGTVKFTEWLKTASQTGRETGSLGHFFDETRVAMEKVWRILEGVGEGLMNVGHAAKPLGDEILDSLGKAAEGWAKFTGSIKGQDDLKNYFTEVKPAIYAIGRLVRDVTDAFFELGKQKGVATLVESIRKTLVPGLQDAAGGVTGFTSGFIDRFDDLRKEGVPAFDAFIQTLAEHAGEASVKIAEALVRGFLNASILGKLAIGGWLLNRFGGKSAITAVGGYVGKQFGAGVEQGATTTAAGGAVTKSLGGRLKSGFISLGKQLGYAMAAYGIFEGVKTAVTESKGAHSLGDALHNFSIGAFRAFGVNLGETTAEEFGKGFQGRIETLSTAGFIGKQNPLTPEIEERAKKSAASQFPEGEDAPGFEEARLRALKRIEQGISARRASAKQLFSSFWGDMEPDERAFAKALRRALVQGERLVKQTGITLPKVKLETNPAQTAKAAKEILGKFDYLRKGIGNNLHDINKVSKEAGERIVQTFGAGTKQGRELTARNMKLTADAIGAQMARSGDITKKGVDRIKELIRNANLLAPTRKMAAEFGDEWSKRIGTTKKATSQAVENIISEARKMPAPMRKIALETWLEQAAQAKKSGKLSVEAFREMRSKLFSEFGVFHKGSKDFNKKVAEGFVGMVNSSGGAMGILMQNLSGLLGDLGDKKKLNWKIIDASIGKDANGASLGRQAGGPVPTKLANGGGLASVVPGTSTGDRHVLALNGRPIAKVESREGIFVGNRNMMAAAKAANDAVPRFQTGGLVGKVQHLRTGGLVEPKLEGNAGPLKQLGQAAIHKVFEGAKSALGKERSTTGGLGGGSVGSMPVGGSVTDHPELQPGISAIVATILKKWPGLGISSTTGGGHAENSLHYSGRAADLAAPMDAAGIKYMLDAAGWIKQKIGADLTEGIHNPNLSIKYGKEVDPSLWGESTWLDHLDHIHVGKQRGGLVGVLRGLRKGGLLKGFQSGGFRGNINHIWAEHNSGTGDWGGPTLPSYVVAALAEAAGDTLVNGIVPGVEAEQITRGESGSGTANSARPGATGEDPGGTKGWGLWMTTTTFNDAVAAKLGGYSKLLNPVKSAAAMALTWPGVYYGDKYVTSPGAHYEGNYDIRDALGGATFKQALEGKAPTKTEAEAEAPSGGTKKLPPKEKPLPSYGGVSTKQITFGHPKTLKATEQEIDRLVGKDGKSGLLKRYRSAANKADKDGKKATADLLTKRVSEIEQRVVGLQNQRRQLRLSEAVKALKKKITGKLSKIAGYDIRVQGAQRLYEQASEYAGNVVGLEPEAPEIAGEPEFPEQAKGESDKVYEKKRRDAHNAYEAQREGIEKDYANRYSGYVEGQERPAYQTVLERVADWRNTILRSERFGFGKGQPSIDDMGRSWEKGARRKIGRIDQINDFTKVVGERIQDYWAKVKKDVSDWRGDHPKSKDLPDWLKKEQDGVPDWLKKQEETRDHLREQLPFLRDEKGQLETAVGEAREAFFSGGDNRLVDPPTLTNLPLPGSGTFEGYLEEVQGIHLYPAMHELLGAGALAPPRDPSRFGGVIWSVQEAIEGLGLKVRQAGSSVQKASIEGEGNGGGDNEGNSERESPLEDLLKQANERLSIKGALEPVLKQFEASYPLPSLPFAGTFHSGGTIAGPSSQEFMAKVRGEEHVLTPKQMAALTPADESTAGEAPVIERLVIHPDGSATMRYRGREFETAVREVVRSTPPSLGSGSGAGRTFRP